MKKKFILLIFLFILVCLISFVAYSNYAKEKRDTITGETVTGEITEANLAITITVSGSPSLIIISPENETYITNKSILLNYTATGEDSVWYNIDGEDNTTITSATYFNITEGLHTLYLYANNSEGNTTANVTFTVNLSLFTVLYNEYAGSTKGSSTDFNKSSYEDLQDLSGIILENTGWGKIQFYEAINVTNDSDISDNEVDLDTNTNISENRIELNSTALPNFNKSATLYLSNLAFSDPRVLRDGGVCPDAICTEIDYSGGTLVFNVTQFTVYSAEEGPAEVTPPGRGGRIIVKKDFYVSRETIFITLKQGETKSESFLIRNIGNTRIEINLENPKLADFIKISETEFYLNADESKVIILDFLARENTIPDLYMGKIIIKGDGIEKEVLIAIEVETKKPLFDVKVEIPRKFLYVIPGEELFAEIELYNLGGTGRIDVNLEYFIKDDEESIIVSEQETLAVETRTNFIKKFEIPEDIKFGKYIFYVKVTYDEEVASASAWFSVGKKPFFTLKNILIIGIILVIILIIMLYKFEKKKIKKSLFKPIFKKKRKEQDLRDYKRRVSRIIEKHKKVKK